MRLKLPPLKSLNSLIVCARTLNFTKTASELNLTQGAVSKQIANLEDYLGVKLFERGNRSLTLTQKGKIYADKIEKSLSKIEIDSKELNKLKTSKNKEVLNINALPSVSSVWLTPLLQNFERRFPQYKVVVKIGDGEVNFEKLGCDLAIRVATHKNKASWKNFKSSQIMGEKLACVCSQQFRKNNKVKEAHDLLKHNLLGHTYRPQTWHKYLKHFGLKKPHVEHSTSFEHFFMLIEAVKSGMGIGLIPKFLIEKELKNKELELILEDDFESNYSYFILQRKQKNTPKKIVDFVDWIKEIS